MNGEFGMMNVDSFHSTDFMNCGSIVGWLCPPKDKATRPPRLSESDGGQERYHKFSFLNIQFCSGFARIGFYDNRVLRSCLSFNTASSLALASTSTVMSRPSQIPGKSLMSIKS